mgnify:CR=1 FL=1
MKNNAARRNKEIANVLDIIGISCGTNLCFKIPELRDELILYEPKQLVESLFDSSNRLDNLTSIDSNSEFYNRLIQDFRIKCCNCNN